jgi:Lrp/AsnC family transcriptional regulator
VRRRSPEQSPADALDPTDRRILALLQADATMPLQKIAAKVNLSTTPCWRRIQRLKQTGVIRRTVAIVDPAKVDLPVSVFVGIKTSQHNVAWLERFARSVRELPEVVEFYRMSGDVDYLLRIVVPDIAGYDAVYKKLIRTAELTDVSSSFAMEQIKYTTALPLDLEGDT